ncbi:MAG: PIG-L deacetylase family protein [Syntrophobacteraceae bacterium]
MRYKAAVISSALLLFLSAFHICFAQENPSEQYLQKVSLSSPVALRSVKDMIQLGKPHTPGALPSFDPFSYIDHGQLEVSPGTRVMIFVPHPDDEALAASGLIERVVQNQGKVRTVFVTNGDGYVEAVRLKMQRARVTPKAFIEYGKNRQEEAIQAACELGMQPEDLVFLGFPDDGIDELWESYWSKLKPFVSPYTLFDRPHRKGLNRWVKYSGTDLKQEIGRVIAEFMPEWVVLPDPRDHHPDHATAGVFVLDALRGLYQEDETEYRPSRVLTYLVHFKDFPHGAEWTKTICAAGVGGCPVSGKTLSNTKWVTLPLTSEEIEGKRRALLAHNSQIQMLGGFFKSFLLPSEMFGSLDMMQVIAVPQEYAAHHKHPLPKKSRHSD